MPWAAILQEILGISATLLSIFAKSYEAHNNPTMVLNSVQKFHQDLKDKQRQIDEVAANPKATEADHQKALDAIRIAQSCIVFALLLFLSSCSFTGTVAPKPVTPARAADWAKHNVIDANAAGVLVTSEWVRVYQEMLKEEGNKLPVSNRPGSPNDGVKPEGSNFRVTYEVSDRFADLKYFERNGSP